MPNTFTINEGEVSSAPSSGLAESTNLTIQSPVVTTAFDEYLLRKKRAASIRQNAVNDLQLQFVDADGNAVDLTAYSIGGSSSGSSSSVSGSSTGTGAVKVRYRDAALVDPRIYEVTAALGTATSGIVVADIPLQVRQQSGIYLAEAGALNASSQLLFSNEIYLMVEHSAWANEGDLRTGPPQINDVRLSLRDNDPYENELLENYDFGLVELCYAAVRTVQFWNDTSPRIAGAVYSTHNFPFRDIWLTGAHLFLYEMASEHYRRNRLPHSVGRVQVDDKNRESNYNAAWQAQFQRFTQMVRMQKARLNMNRGYGSLGGYRGYDG